ncbi:hypothetical protein BJ138DRAFT_1099658 [Hygrophoropsis aurantiaca]|uniref:Uncharacterized protein n=1 Tax=Hygrophoropsis aurantiaca TaxID=72124 RepID=A0ACB8AJ76_9AGAM|nr:hypothetical protein BJ138DRAFT_1099658 [Hygrophoropsis aurantiaca]
MPSLFDFLTDLLSELGRVVVVGVDKPLGTMHWIAIVDDSEERNSARRKASRRRRVEFWQRPPFSGTLKTVTFLYENKAQRIPRTGHICAATYPFYSSVLLADIAVAGGLAGNFETCQHRIKVSVNGNKIWKLNGWKDASKLACTSNLKIPWTVLSATYKQQNFQDADVRDLAESLREMICVAHDCPDLREIEGTVNVTEEIGCTALKIAVLIEECTNSSLIGRIQSRDKETRHDVKKIGQQVREQLVPGVDIIGMVDIFTSVRNLETEKILQWLAAPDLSVGYNSSGQIRMKRERAESEAAEKEREIKVIEVRRIVSAAREEEHRRRLQEEIANMQKQVEQATRKAEQAQKEQETAKMKPVGEERLLRKNKEQLQEELSRLRKLVEENAHKQELRKKGLVEKQKTG